MNRKSAWYVVLTMAVVILGSHHAMAQREFVPSDVLKLRPDGYVYADYPGLFFDEAKGEGVTIEAWIYLNKRPKEWDSSKDGWWDRSHDGRGHWIIFAKPGSYRAGIRARNLNSHDRLDPKGTTYLVFDLAHANHNSGGGSRLLLPKEFPFARWLHVAIQVREKKIDKRFTVVPAEMYGFFDRVFILHQWTQGDWVKEHIPVPLMIGGTPNVKYKEGCRWRCEWGQGYGSINGYFDEVRVSRGFRYDKPKNGKLIRPQRHFKVDARTLALWRFEEGPFAASFQDSSGNGYTLLPGGSLSVHGRGKLVTTWGNLKRRNR